MNLFSSILKALPVYLCFLVLSCGPTHAPEISPNRLSSDTFSEGHIDTLKKQPGTIPPALSQTTLLPKPELHPPLETYTVVVNGVAAKDLLFSMARDAQLNLDIHDDITGRVTLNAIDQTLQQILQRIAEQVDIRYSMESNTLRIRRDSPYLQTYSVDYVNISRESKGIVRVATSIGSTGQGNISNQSGGSSGSGSSSGSSGGGSSSGGGGSSGRGGQNLNNSSMTEVLLKSNNNFWDSLTRNIIEILNETGIEDTESSDGFIDNSSDVIVNRETGLMMVRATYKRHQEIQAFIDRVLSTSKRQVMIEATIAEIKLSDRYQAGVDWQMIAESATSGVNILTNFRASQLSQPPFTSLTLNDKIGGNQVSAALHALEQFGDVQVLSSPKVMAINNQPAILKVVDNLVYFEMQVDTTSNQTNSITTFETLIKTVPVGFVMSVTPYINDHEAVTLNIRPTISRVIDQVVDPNPAFNDNDVVSSVPVIQVREIESILTINSGDTAVIGGLMQDTINNKTQGVPFLSSLPLIGGLFRFQDDVREKSELVIFIRPVVIHHASLTGDLSDYQKFLRQPANIVPRKNKDKSTDDNPAE